MAFPEKRLLLTVKSLENLAYLSIAQHGGGQVITMKRPKMTFIVKNMGIAEL